MNNHLNRKEFIRKTLLLTTAIAIIPRFVLGRSKAVPLMSGAEGAAAPIFNMDPNAIIDLHCHPSLKMYLLDKKFWLRHLLRSPGGNMIHMQEDVHEFSFGYVRGMIATHYLPEGGIEKEWGTVKFLWPLIKKIAFKTADKIEHEDYSNFTQINIMIDTLESQIHIANEKLAIQGPSALQFVIARNYKEFTDALSTPDNPKNTIPLAHSIEGAHALGRNLVRSPKKISKRKKQQAGFLPGEHKMQLNGMDKSYLYVRNLEALHARGVCLMTLSHFFDNDLSFPVEGISPKQKKTPGMTWTYDPATMNKPLTDIGEVVVDKMFEIGMIVDLTHTTPKVREGAYNINNKRRDAGKQHRPIVFSHSASQKIFDEHDQSKNKNYGFYCVSQADIDAICDCDGVIAVIPEIFWLAGSNTDPKIDGQTPADVNEGIPYIIQTLKDINDRTPKKDFRNIAIGTDFDGLADNPKDLYLNSQLNGLIAAMQADPVLKQDDRIALITYKNTHRVLEKGWGNHLV